MGAERIRQRYYEPYHIVNQIYNVILTTELNCQYSP